MKCISFWCQAYSVIKHFSPIFVGSFSEIVFNSVSPAGVWSALLWFLIDAKTYLWYRERGVERRGEEKVHCGTLMGAGVPALAPPLPRSLYIPHFGEASHQCPPKKAQGTGLRGSHLNVEISNGQPEPLFRVWTEHGAWSYS